MLKTLIKVRLLSLFVSPGKKKKKKNIGSSIGKKILIGILSLYIIAAMFLAFGALFVTICEPYHAIGIDWFYFTFASIIAFALMFIGSVFMTQSQLYDSKDNEMLLAMPIPAKYILGSRIIALYFYNLIFELLIFLPAGAVYVYYIGATVGKVFAFILVLILLPLLALALSCLLGLLIMAVISKLKLKTLFTMVFSIGFMLLYFYFYGNINDYLTLLTNNGDVLAGNLKGLTPLYWLGNAIANADILHLILVALMCIVPFAIIYLFLSATFIKLVTRKKGVAKKQYQAKSMKVSGIKTTLLSRELKHFINSPTYMLNTGMGIIFMVIAIVAALINLDMLYSVIEKKPSMEPTLALLLAAALAFMSVTNTITATMISLEGKSIAMLRSFPVRTKDILMAKVHMHLLITEPFIIIGTVLILVLFKVNLLMAAVIIVLPTLMNIFTAFFGLFINLLLPKMDWASETVAIKQSASPTIALLSGFAFPIAAVLIYAFLLYGMRLDIYIGIVIGIVLLATIILYWYIVTRGVKRFENL